MTPAEAPPPGALSFWRWGCLFALLLGEILLITIRFDTETLLDRSGWWLSLLAHGHHLLRLILVSAAATLLFGGKRLYEEAKRLGPRLAWNSRNWLLLAAQLLVFFGFFQITAFIWERVPAAGANQGLWLAAWVLTGLGTVVLWAATLLPGWAWRHLATKAILPILGGIAVGLAAWTAGFLTDRLWEPLGRSTMWLARHLLGLVFNEVLYYPEHFIIGTRAFPALVSPQCSGYEGIGLLWVFLGAYLWFFRHQLRFPQALLLLPLGTVLMWFANGVRIATLIAIGSWGWRDVAVGGFHSQAGWLAFIAISLGMVAVAHRWRFFSKAETSNQVNAPSRGTAAYLAPFLVIVAAAMIGRAFSSGFDWLYPARVLAAAVVLWWFWREYADLRWTFSWDALAIGVAAFAIWLPLQSASAESGNALASGLSGLSPAGYWCWLIFRVVGHVITVPLAEELAFRGYLTRRLIAADFQSVPVGRFSWLSFLVSSALFGLMHGTWLAGLLAGMLYALAVYRRGELTDAVVAHAITNALIAAYVLTTGSWFLWA